MIQATDLRLGNIVLINGLRTKVSLLVLQHLIEGNIQFTVEGLKISEEILLKCGFVNKFSNSWSNHVLQIFQNKGNVAGIELDDFYVSTGQRYVTSFKHLHQLQNIYVALTGEELNVKPLLQLQNKD